MIFGSRISFIVKVGEPSIYQFSVTADDGDTYVVGIVGGIPFGSNLTNNQGNYTFTWILQQVQNVSLIFYATDSLNATFQLSIPVLICACQNGGNCTLEGPIDTYDKSVVMACNCSKGMYFENQFHAL